MPTRRHSGAFYEFINVGFLTICQSAGMFRKSSTSLSMYRSFTEIRYRLYTARVVILRGIDKF